MGSGPPGARGWHIRRPLVWVRIHREDNVSNKTEGFFNTLAAMAVYHLRLRGGP